jgi:hypothetical protein
MKIQDDVPGYPASRAIKISDKAMFDGLFAKMQPSISEFTFTNLFLWGAAKRYSMSKFEGHVLVFYESHGKRIFLPPIGKEPEGIIKKILSESGNAEFQRVPEEIALKLNDPSLSVEEDRNSFDYVYLRKDLADLPGAKYSPKRSFVRRALENSPVVVENPDANPSECMRLQEEWCKARMCESDEAMKQENEAIYTLFLNKKELWVTCVVIRIGGKVAAFAAGEPLNDDTYVIHFEKADTKYTGIYQLINNEFAKRIPPKFKYVNREQDLGIEGMRKAKESYHPVHMVKKFRVSNPSRAHGSEIHSLHLNM